MRKPGVRPDTKMTVTIAILIRTVSKLYRVLTVGEYSSFGLTDMPRASVISNSSFLSMAS